MKRQLARAFVTTAGLVVVMLVAPTRAEELQSLDAKRVIDGDTFLGTRGGL